MNDEPDDPPEEPDDAPNDPNELNDEPDALPKEPDDAPNDPNELNDAPDALPEEPGEALLPPLGWVAVHLLLESMRKAPRKLGTVDIGSGSCILHGDLVSMEVLAKIPAL